MSLQHGELLGVQDPQILHLPPDVASLAAAQEAIELADAYGVAGGFPLDASQRFTLTAGLGERADGSWAAATVADFEPRQNGKNDTCGARELAGLILFGEQLIIHTAHEFPTANESFLRLVAVFEAWDDLRRRVSRIRYANGEQGIELSNGARLKYRARTGGSGRGFAKADLVVYDEAQHLRPEHLAASAPAKLANPNSQSWYMGSGGLASSTAARQLRKRAVMGNAGRLAYIEHTAEQLVVIDGRLISTRPDDITDRRLWALANPSLGHRNAVEKWVDLLGELGPEMFARECLCVWDVAPDDEMPDRPIAPESWGAYVDERSSIVGPLVLGVGVLPELSSSAIAAVGRRDDGLMHVEIIEAQPGTRWLETRLRSLIAGHQVAAVAVDTGGPSVGVLPELVRVTDSTRTELVKIGGKDYTGACAAFVASVADDRVRHLGQAWLATAIGGARRRAVGESWVWDLQPSAGVDVSPLVAVTVALRAFEQMPPIQHAPMFAFSS